MYIKIDMSRKHVTSLSSNSFRETSSNSAISSIDYIEWVQAQANNRT